MSSICNVMHLATLENFMGVREMPVLVEHFCDESRLELIPTR